jgi:hypothetical protein
MNRLRVVVGACAVAVAILLVVALAGGGGKNATLVSGSALADAARATERVPGVSVSMDQTVEADGLPKPLHIRLHGIENMRQRAADLVGVYEDFPKKVPGQRPDGSIPVESIVIVPHVYMRSPLFGSVLPSGKSWLDLDLAKSGRKLGIGDPTQFGNTDPSQSVQGLRAVSSRVERVGTENVRGVATTHYRTKVELRRLPAVTTPAQRPAARRMVTRLIQLTGTDSYPIEVWVDRRHLVRRARIVLDMKVQGTRVKQDMSMDLFDFGPKQKIKPPPANESFDTSKLTGAGSGP